MSQCIHLYTGARSFETRKMHNPSHELNGPKYFNKLQLKDTPRKKTLAVY